MCFACCQRVLRFAWLHFDLAPLSIILGLVHWTALGISVMFRSGFGGGITWRNYRCLFWDFATGFPWTRPYRIRCEVAPVDRGWYRNRATVSSEIAAALCARPSVVMLSSSRPRVEQPPHGQRRSPSERTAALWTPRRWVRCRRRRRRDRPERWRKATGEEGEARERAESWSVSVPHAYACRRTRAVRTPSIAHALCFGFAGLIS